ncbi:MAG: hypothetical protein U0325_10450 [Polyangiales bacterium]
MSVAELILEAYRAYDEARNDGKKTVPPPSSLSLPPLEFMGDTLVSLPSPPVPLRLDTLVPAESPREPSPLPPLPDPPSTVPMHAGTQGSVELVLSELAQLEGFLGAALVNSELGRPLGMVGSGLDVAVAAVGNAQVVQAKRTTLKSLDLRDEIEDVLITLGEQYHLIRPVRARPWLFFYMALDRSLANLAMARMQLADAERSLVI